MQQRTVVQPGLRIGMVPLSLQQTPDLQHAVIGESYLK